MVTVALKTPVCWVVRGASDPIIRVAFTNDSTVSTIHVYYADSATADDDDWTEIGTGTGKPSPVTNPYISVTDTGRGFDTTYYYRACQKSSAATQRSEYSGVVESNKPTFLFELRDDEGFIRGIQFQADTDDRAKGVTWFEGMEIMTRQHTLARERLRLHFKEGDVDDFWESPPANLAEWVRLRVHRDILVRHGEPDETTQRRIRLCDDEINRVWIDFVSDNRVRMANRDEVKTVHHTLRVG